MEQLPVAYHPVANFFFLQALHTQNSQNIQYTDIKLNHNKYDRLSNKTAKSNIRFVPGNKASS